MGLLEDALRQTFAAHVVVPPAVEDQADRAIWAAQRIRRRHGLALAATALVGALALTASIGLVLANRAGPPGSGVGAGLVPSPDLPTYVLGGGEIDGPGQARLALADLPALRAWRYASGFLVETTRTSETGVRLWWVPNSGGSVALVEADHLEVAPARQTQGLQSGPGSPVVAWDVAGKVSVARFGDGRLSAPQTTGGAGGLRVAGLVSDGVLLASDRGSFDMWFPGRGAFQPGPSSNVRMLAVSSDGIELYGVVGAGCFGSIAPHGMTVKAQTCSAGIGTSDGVWPSPDGRLIVVTSTDSVRVFDLSSIFRGTGPTATWRLRASAATWLADGSLAVLTPDGTVRLASGGGPAAAPALAPRLGGSATALVPDLNP